MSPVHPVRAFSIALGMTLLFQGLGVAIVRAQTVAPGLMQEGAQLYAQNCAVCHGTQGQGRVGATLAKNWPSIRPDLRIRATIENGIVGSPMPAWSVKNGGPLQDNQIEALVAYILSWETGGLSIVPTLPPATPRPAISPVPEVQGNPNRGAQLYDQNCAVCHGTNAEGRVGATLAKDWPAIRPDLEIKSTIINGIPGSMMPAWSQANGGPLTEQEVDDIVSFVLSLQQRAKVEEEGAPAEAAPFRVGWLASWGGILLLIGSFIAIVSLALWAQTRRR